MPAVGAATGPGGVAELGVGVGVGVLELKLDELGVTAGVEEEELLDGVGVLEAEDETEVLLGVGGLLLEELTLTDVEVTAGVEELLDVVSAELLALVLVELIDDDMDDDELLLGITELLVDERRLEEAMVELLLGLGVLELVDETVEVTNPEEEVELKMLEDVIELLTATAMTLAPQTPLLLGVPTPLFR